MGKYLITNFSTAPGMVRKYPATPPQATELEVPKSLEVSKEK